MLPNATQCRRVQRTWVRLFQGDAARGAFSTLIPQCPVRCCGLTRGGLLLVGSWLSHQPKPKKKEPGARVCAFRGRGVRGVMGALRGTGRLDGVGGSGRAAAR